jgi:menaquinone-specific isochorismate synthase
VTLERNCIKNHQEQIASICLDIDKVDPLVVLEKLASPNDINFYWDNGKKEAIAALGVVAKLEIAGEDRFSKAQKFIKHCLHRVRYFCTSNQPRFFCSFTFFNESQKDYPFPAATVFLPRWEISLKPECCTLIANFHVNAGISVSQILENIKEKIELISSLKNPSRLDLVELQSNKLTSNHQKFKDSVISALEKINRQKLRKVVLADVLDVESCTDFNIFKSLHNLRQIHPNCCTFFISNGKGQNFIGASPERLMSIHKQKLITDALAGSAPRGQTPVEDAINAKSLLKSEKEAHEHSLVIDFITNRLSHLGLLPQILTPRLRKLSNIQHLWTPITAIVPKNVHPLEILAQLHPTPATAGASRDIACAEIQRYESFERGLYAAPIGWIDFQGNCEFIVGIRSGLIDGDRARLYAGAGIVAGSDPNKELAEIELKLQALLKALI